MALFPWGMWPQRDWWRETDPVTRLFDQHFGMGLMNDDLLAPPTYHPFYIIASRSNRDRLKSGVSEVVNDKDKFQVNLDVQQFTPEEISVKTVENSVVIEGKHEEKRDEHGFISRHFQRRYLLPENVRPESIQSSLSSDGVLTVTAPKMAIEGALNERMVPITRTNQPAMIEGEEKADRKE
ncbi:unnamed protein product [Darwinula stevensoni]|uniref:SHSP domain-containing protein n=1 Tax=Darwinula stevensoni TaxID=69355 RepID=A0A7R9ABY9_9CRUS|nr:unnamed protein product [Darwinula stevensoni]CAG0899901.1 unnamed protein product [Darwinula stevensoni]